MKLWVYVEESGKNVQMYNSKTKGRCVMSADIGAIPHIDALGVKPGEYKGPFEWKDDKLVKCIEPPVIKKAVPNNEIEIIECDGSNESRQSALSVWPGAYIPSRTACVVYRYEDGTHGWDVPGDFQESYIIKD